MKFVFVLWQLFSTTNCVYADLGGLAVQGVGLQSLNCWECRFESRWG